jgi:hypothetical protein
MCHFWKLMSTYSIWGDNAPASKEVLSLMWCDRLWVLAFVVCLAAMAVVWVVVLTAFVVAAITASPFILLVWGLGKLVPMPRLWFPPQS